MSEKAIREAAEKSGLDYTVVRPGSLTDAKRPKDACLVSSFFTNPAPRVALLTSCTKQIEILVHM